MTRDDFQSRYRLLQTARRSGGAITHHALSPEGAVVMVHFLDGDPDLVASLLERIESAGPSIADRVIERTEVEGTPVLVTRFIMDFEGLDGWLPPLPPGTSGLGAPPEEGAAKGSREVEASPTPGAPLEREPPGTGGSDDGPGEFTRMFRAVGGDGGAPSESPPAPPAEPPPPAPAAPPPVAPPPAADGPGEFTRQFGRLDPPVPAPDDVSAGPPPPAAPPAEPPPPAPPAAPPAAPPPPADGPGEFTRQFGRLDPPVPGEDLFGGPPPETPSRDIPSPRYGIPDEGEGGAARDSGASGGGSVPVPEPDFGAFSRPRSPAPSTPPPPPPPATGSPPSYAPLEDSYLDRLHEAAPPAPEPAPPPPEASAAPSGPGAYTRVIAGMTPPPMSGFPDMMPGAPSPSAPEPIDEGKKGSATAFVVALVLIVVAAVAIVVTVALIG